MSTRKTAGLPAWRASSQSPSFRHHSRRIRSGAGISAHWYTGAAKTVSSTVRSEAGSGVPCTGMAVRRRSGGQQRGGEDLEVEAFLPHPKIVVGDGEHAVEERIDEDLHEAADAPRRRR